MSEKITPFKSDIQFECWIKNNCKRCKKYHENHNTLQNCEIENSLNENYLYGVQISKDVLKRIGFFDKGRQYVWKCLEVDWTEEWMAECRRGER